MEEFGDFPGLVAEFRNLEEPRPVRRVRMVDDAGNRGWYEVAGLQDGKPGQAMACRVEDSGSGVAWLVFGGNQGVRLEPSGRVEAYLMKGRAEDLEFIS